MPRWIHARAKHILAKNPNMEKSQAFAIATQQSHKLGKSPKGYGTDEGKERAEKKYGKSPKEYTKKPNPGSLKTPKLASKKMDTKKLKADVVRELDQMQGKRPGEWLMDRVVTPTLKKYSSMREELHKVAFTRSQYSGPLSYGSFKMVSGIPAFRAPSLQKVSEGDTEDEEEKKAYDQTGVGTISDPANALKKRQKIGRPGYTPGGPSIRDIAKPEGYGKGIPGALKNRV